MATPWSVAVTTFFFSILLLEVVCSSGASVDCTYGSPQVKRLSSSVFTEQQNAYIFLQPFQRSCRASQLAGEFVSGDVVPKLQLNVSAVVVTADERQLGALHRTMDSVHTSLAAAGLDRRVKVSPELSLPSLRAMAKNQRNKREHWRRVMEFVRRSGSFVVVEMGADENGDLAVADVAAAVDDGVGVAFRVNRRDSPMARLIGDAVKGKRSMGVLAEASASSSPRRELDDVFAPVTNPTTMPSTTTNPVTVPATNPATNPGVVTVPSTNPAAGYSNNPTNLPKLYPEPTPVTMPDSTTTTTPTATPFMNPVTSPVTNPTTTPVTNPATTPAVTYPYPQQGGGGAVPMTPTYQPPATAQTTMTWCVAKTGLMDAVLQNGLDYACGMGGADCSAIQPMGSCYNPNTMQAHASYAFNAYFQRNPSPASCDFGGAGMLVNVNPSSGTCMFQTSAGYSVGNSPAVTGTVPVGGVTPMGPAVGGAGMTPMGGTGVTPMGPAVGGAGMTPMGGTGVTPMGPAVGGGSGSTVLNANSPGAGGNSMYGGSGSDNPTSLTGCAASLSCGWVLCLVWIFTFAYVKEKV